MDYSNHITSHEKGKHLSYEDYILIELRLKDGWKANAIAQKELHCSPNTVRNIIKKGMTLRHIPLTMEDWENWLNGFIQMFEYGLLKDAGKVSAEIAKLHAKTAFEKYRVIQDRLFMSDFDRYLLELEEQASKDKS